MLHEVAEKNFNANFLSRKGHNFVKRPARVMGLTFSCSLDDVEEVYKVWY